VGGEGVEIVHFEGEVGDIVADIDGGRCRQTCRSRFLLAAGGLEEDELGAAGRFAAANELEPEDVAIEGDGFFPDR